MQWVLVCISFVFFLLCFLYSEVQIMMKSWLQGVMNEKTHLTTSRIMSLRINEVFLILIPLTLRLGSTLCCAELLSFGAFTFIVIVLDKTSAATFLRLSVGKLYLQKHNWFPYHQLQIGSKLWHWLNIPFNQPFGSQLVVIFCVFDCCDSEYVLLRGREVLSYTMI